MKSAKIVLGITGASGAIYAWRFMQLIRDRNLPLDLAVVFSKNAKKVWEYELKAPYSDIPYKIYPDDDFFVPFASGSSSYEKMVIMPCSMATIGKIANGITDTLITRAADVMLKERKRLVLVPREMPYNAIHLENMYKLTLQGAVICPASPSFYSFPSTIEDLVDTVLQKVFKLLDLNITFFRWQEKV